MADRILTWYLDALMDDQVSLGPTHMMDRDYIPQVVRVHAKRAPGSDVEFDIRDDGASIFDAQRPVLPKDETFEDVAQDFLPDATTIAKYSLVTLHLISGGTPGMTAQLELVAAEDDEVAETDT